MLKKFIRSGVDAEDLMQEGFCGLFKAYERFNPDIGVSFLTYAYPWVFAAMQNHVEGFSGPVRASHGAWAKNREDVRDAQEVLHPSLPYCFGDDFSAAPLPGVLDSNEVEPESLFMKLDSQIVYEAIMYLPLVQQRIVLAHFFEEQHFSAIAQEMGVTKQRVHQIFQDAIANLRKRLRLKNTKV